MQSDLIVIDNEHKTSIARIREISLPYFYVCGLGAITGLVCVAMGWPLALSLYPVAFIPAISVALAHLDDFLLFASVSTLLLLPFMSFVAALSISTLGFAIVYTTLILLSYLSADFNYHYRKFKRLSK